MTKPKTLEQLRADKERDRDAACTGTAQVGASGEQKEVSGTGRTGRNFDRNGKDHAAQRGRDAFGSTHDQAPKAAKFAVLNPGHAGFPNRVERSEGSDTTPHLARSESTAHRVKKQQHHQVANRSRSPAGPRRLGTATRISASLSRRLSAFFGSTLDRDPKSPKYAVLIPGPGMLVNVRNAPRVVIPPPSETPPVSACKPLCAILLRKPSVYPLSFVKANVGRL